jgi:hypothetical protein
LVVSAKLVSHAIATAVVCAQRSADGYSGHMHPPVRLQVLLLSAKNDEIVPASHRRDCSPPPLPPPPRNTRKRTHADAC